MIDRIVFKAGVTPLTGKLSLEVSPITVFVGPNNSGKSQLLVELQEWSISNSASKRRIIDDVLFSPITSSELAKNLTLIESTIPAGQFRRNDGFINLSIGSNGQPDVVVHEGSLEQCTSNPHNQKSPNDAYSTLRRLYTVRLDGQSRLNLLNEQQAGDLQKPQPGNRLARLFRDNNLREQVRDIVFRAFGRHFVIDPTNVGKLRVRLSSRPPHSETEERGLTDASVKFHGEATPIAETSDGVKAFVGIITTLVAGTPKITLIDEPEAFLHPALAMKLGKEVGASLAGSKNRLLVSTHSASFLMGCIQSGPAVSIVRLTYSEGVGTTRILPRERLLHLMRNPMLRSTGVLDGLFYEAVIVTEADADRAFYQEVNERLRTFHDGRAIGNCLFLNAQNKQTVWDIVKPLRELGIPTVGIVDLDMVKDGGSDFTKIVTSASVPTINRTALAATRKSILDALNTISSTWKRDGGLEVLSNADRQGADDYFNQLEQYGVFVVRGGELESWLRPLGVPKNKYQWLPKMFERMGEDPVDPNYVTPTDGDVWDFIGRIRQWLDNPNRKGIPE